MKRPFVLLTVLLVAGCATNNPPPPPAAQLEPYVVTQHGRVTRVNAADGYVVLECTFLPTAGEEITLYRDRGKQISSRVRVNEHSSGHWVAADIVEGYPMTGDWFIGKPAESKNKSQP